MLECLLKRPSMDTALTSVSTFLQCCKYCFFTALFIQFWCLDSFRIFFFCFFTVTSARLSLPTNTSFLQMVWEYTYFLQKSHGLACHSISNFSPWLSVIISTGIYTYQLVMLTQKSLGFLLDKSFHPTRLCFHPSFSEAIPSQVSTPSHMFWALSGAVLLSFCSPQSYFWASVARVNPGVEKQSQMNFLQADVSPI